MVLIGGISVEHSKLPMSDYIEYKVENNIDVLKVLLKSQAKKDSCLDVFLNSSLADIQLSADVSAKTTYFNTEEELLEKLKIEDTLNKEIFATDVKSEAKNFSEDVLENNLNVLVNDSDFLVKTDEDVHLINTVYPKLLEDFNKLSETLNEVKTQLDIQNKVVEEQKTQLVELKEEKETTDALSSSSIEKDKQDIENKLCQAEESYNTLKSEYEGKLSEISENHSKDLNTLKEELDNLKENFNNLNEQHSSLNISLGVNKTTYETKVVELEDIIGKLTLEKETEVSKANAKILELQTKCSSGVAKTDEYSKELQQAKLDYKDMVDTYELNISTLKNNYDSLKSEYDEYKESKETKINLDSDSNKPLEAFEYVKNSKRVINATLTDIEKAQITGVDVSNIKLLAFGTESNFTLFDQVVKIIGLNKELIVVDFTSDILFSDKYKLDVSKNSLNLTNDLISVDKLVQKSGKCHFIPSCKFHDVALTGINWGVVLRRLAEYAEGKPVIILLNCIDSFGVKYALAKLSKVLQTFIYTKGNAYVIKATFGQMSLIDTEKLTMNVIGIGDNTKPLLNLVGKKYQAYLTDNNSMIDVRVLGLKLD